MYPKLRPHQISWMQHNGQEMLYLRERTGLSDRAIMIPAPLAPIITLFDGTRDAAALRAAFLLHSGIDLNIQTVEHMIGQLDESLLLESPRAEAAYRAILEEYRREPFRAPSLAGKAYPADPDELKRTLDGFVEAATDRQVGFNQTGSPSVPNGIVRGVISPHIDFDRGGHIYARVWQEVRESARDVDLAIIFGTDHAGGFGKLTLTRQNYCTPWGVLPTDTDVVHRLAEAIGCEDAYEEELNHRGEHSVELASIWLHYVLDGAPSKIVPILCGSFHHFVVGAADPDSDARINAALTVLREATRGRRTLVIAAADLAHVGPAFGDPAPLGVIEKAGIAAADKALLETLQRGSARAFMNNLRDEEDRRRVCGLPPIYLTLRLLGESQGRAVDYAQCPADEDGGSLVSITGVVLH